MSSQSKSRGSIYSTTLILGILSLGIVLVAIFVRSQKDTASHEVEEISHPTMPISEELSGDESFSLEDRQEQLSQDASSTGPIKVEQSTEDGASSASGSELVPVPIQYVTQYDLETGIGGDITSEVWDKPDFLNISSMAGYWLGNNAILYKQAVVEGADASSFKMVMLQNPDKYHNQIYHIGIDADHVYSHGTQIPNADPNSYVYMTNGFGKDVHRVFSGTTTIPGADPKTFVFLDNGFFGDATQVWYIGYIDLPNSRESAIVLVEGADPETFESLGARYSRDVDNVYYFGDVLSGVDPATFTIYKNTFSHKYTSDANNVYFENEPILSGVIDVASFEVVGIAGEDGTYIKDANAVYFNNKEVSGIDAQTFEQRSCLFVDKDHVYKEGKKIWGAKPDTVNTCDYCHCIQEGF